MSHQAAYPTVGEREHTQKTGRSGRQMILSSAGACPDNAAPAELERNAQPIPGIPASVWRNGVAEWDGWRVDPPETLMFPLLLTWHYVCYSLCRRV
jgi:hypothetical protein